MPPALDPRLLLLAPRDNAAVARVRIRGGDAIKVGDGSFVTPQDIPIGHKIAVRAIVPGEKVLKYGAPIGSAVAAIGPGEHVHVHNLQSDYTPTYTLDAARAKHGAGS